LYDTKGRFVIKAVTADEAKFKLCRIKKRLTGPNKVPYVVTHDGRTIRFPHPDIEVNDTAKVDIATGTIVDFVKFEIGNVCFTTSGNNVGRVGIIITRERHLGGFDIIHVQDERGHQFSTRIGNIFPIGKGKKPWITLPKGNGVYLSPAELKEKQENASKKKKAH
jgi:small subunit ribosomal protein S4e